MLQAIPLGEIRPNPNQPRKKFEPKALAELAASIRNNGLMQPIRRRFYRNVQRGHAAGQRDIEAKGLNAGRLHFLEQRLASFVGNTTSIVGGAVVVVTLRRMQLHVGRDLGIAAGLRIPVFDMDIADALVRLAAGAVMTSAL